MKYDDPLNHVPTNPHTSFMVSQCCMDNIILLSMQLNIQDNRASAFHSLAALGFVGHASLKWSSSPIPPKFSLIRNFHSLNLDVVDTMLMVLPSTILFQQRKNVPVPNTCTKLQPNDTSKTIPKPYLSKLSTPRWDGQCWPWPETLPENSSVWCQNNSNMMAQFFLWFCPTFLTSAQYLTPT